MAVEDAHVFPGFLTPATTFLTCFSRGERRKKKFASIGYRISNHKVMSPTRPPLNYPGRTVYREESQIRLSTLQNDLYLSDSDSDDEASNSNTVYNNELFDSEKTLGSENDSVDAASSDAETTSSSEEDSSSDTEYNSLVDDDDDSAIIIDNSSSSQSEASANDHLIHSKSLHHVFDVLPPNCISSAQIGNTEGLSYPWSRGQKRKRQDEVMHCPSKRRKMESPIPSKPTCFKESLKRPASGSIGYDFFCENAASSDCDSASSSEEDSWSDESSSSKREASSTESDESNEMTKNQQIHSASLHKASDVLMTDCISSAQIGNTEGLCYPGGKGQKRKRQDEGLHYSFKRRKIESLIPSKPTCFQESRKHQTSGSTGYDTFRDKTASSDDDSTSSSQENPWLDESSSSQREASSTESDESNAMTTEQQIHSASLHKASDGSMSNCITLTGIANTKSLSYPEARGEKRKRQDEDSRYPTKKRKIELPIPSTSTNFTGSRKRPVSGSTDAETLNRVPKTQNIYPDSQDYSCPNTWPCKTPDQPVGILPIDRIFKVNKPLYIKLLQSRTLDSHNLSHYRCCEKSCSIRWYQGRVPAQFLLDEY